MRILYIQYANPGQYPPIEHSSRILAQNGVEIQIMGVASPATGNLSFAPHTGVTVRLLPYAPPGWRQKVHYACYLLWILSCIIQWRPDWVYASDCLVAPLSWLLTFIPRLKVLYHEHDAPDQATSRFMRIVLALRLHLLRRAKLIVVPNTVRGQVLIQESGTKHPIQTVWNCPEQIDVQSQRQNKRQRLQLLYQGSIVPARLPMTVLDALALIDAPIDLHIIGYETIGYPGYTKELQHYATQLKLRGQIIAHGPIPLRSHMLAQTAMCDVGLALMPLQSDDLNQSTMSGASNKPFDYLACGLPLIVSQLPDWQDLYVKPGYALACNPHDPASLASAIMWYATHPVERQTMGANGQQKILSDWNYETQFAPVKHVLLEENL